jgi:hypothetical protein
MLIVHFYMRKGMNRIKTILVLLVAPCLLLADQMSMPAQPGMKDCSMMGPDIAQFSVQLSQANQKMFCGQFNSAQRATAMQLASQQDAMGKSMMSPDQAVQKVAMDNNITPNTSQKTPTGCPVK